MFEGNLMDLLSHSLLPYLLGKISNVKKEYLTALVIGGIAPDFDVFITWINSIYPTSFLITHRGITHSFFFGFFTVVAVLYLACNEKIKSRIRKYVDFNPVFSRRNIAFAYIGVVIHLLLDSLTTRGVPLFYPIDAARKSAEVFFYTDTFLMIVSLAIVVYIFKRPVQKHTYVSFLLIFILTFSIIGSIRINEKNEALGFFGGDKNKAYPSMNPFEWYVISDGEYITTYKYNGFDRSSQYNETVLRLNVLSDGAGLDDALGRAGELPQVKMFKWRAYAVAINASFEEGVWLLEYYDPLQRVLMRDTPSVIRNRLPRLTSLNVSVDRGGTAVY